MKSGGFLQFIIPAVAGLAAGMFGGRGLGRSDAIIQRLSQRGNGLFLKRGDQLYDVTKVKNVKQRGDLLSTILKFATQILKHLGIGALLGTASEGASQIVKKMACKGGNGLFLKKGYNVYDVSNTVQGRGYLYIIKSIPIVGDLLGLFT